MTTPTVLYTQLTYEDYKNLEAQMKAFKETTHTTVTGFHHKSIRIKINDNLIHEYHGAMVGGDANVTGDQHAEVRELPTRL